jgi:hypothetical protein
VLNPKLDKFLYSTVPLSYARNQTGTTPSIASYSASVYDEFLNSYARISSIFFFFIPKTGSLWTIFYIALYDLSYRNESSTKNQFVSLRRAKETQKQNKKMSMTMYMYEGLFALVQLFTCCTLVYYNTFPVCSSVLDLYPMNETHCVRYNEENVTMVKKVDQVELRLGLLFGCYLFIRLLGRAKEWFQGKIDQREQVDYHDMYWVIIGLILSTWNMSQAIYTYHSYALMSVNLITFGVYGCVLLYILFIVHQKELRIGCTSDDSCFVWFIGFGYWIVILVTVFLNDTNAFFGLYLLLLTFAVEGLWCAFIEKYKLKEEACYAALIV